MKSENMLSSLASICLRALEKLLELIGTLLYREMLKRNTLRPMQKIIHERNPDLQRRLLRQWAMVKANESQYIQVAVCALVTIISAWIDQLLIVCSGRIPLHDCSIVSAMARHTKRPLVR